MDILDLTGESTQFGGALRRTADGRYIWADGEDWSPMFRDETIDGYNFRISGGFVHATRRTVDGNEDLGWCKDVAVSPHPVWAPRNVYLVPLAEWDRRRRIPIGVVWDRQDEPPILDKAMELGWTWPGRIAKGLDMSMGTVPMAEAKTS